MKRYISPASLPCEAATRGARGSRQNAQEALALYIETLDEFGKTIPEHWVDLKQGQRAELFEQMYPQQDGCALLMLWLEIEEVEEVDDDRTSKQRFRDQQSRWR
jgi:hypothetical protein